MSIVMLRKAWVVLLLRYILCCMSLEPEPPSYELNSMQNRYEKWLQKYERIYQDRNERDVRFGIYQSNVQYIDYINSQNLSYKLVDNKYADLTNEEFRAMYMGYKSTRHSAKPKHKHKSKFKNITQDLPVNVDWRKEGAVTRVREQGRCGACWAFSAVAALEGINKIKTGNLTTLSEQMLMDCDINNGDEGCRGGLMTTAYEFIIKNGGITTAKDYPYVGRDESCNISEAKNHPVTIKEYKKVPTKDEKSLQAAVARQPVSVAIANGFLFQLYSSGVFSGPCGTHLSHAVTIVGYGEEHGRKYWIAKNSWGEDWGENGYMRIKRGSKDKRGKCAIAVDCTYPVLS